jgi:endonuclease/exonuclease/phosphatase family metal-dependent hydrolase
LPPFPRPAFPFEFDVDGEVRRLRAHKRTRAVPARRSHQLLIASWNIANLGTQQRDRSHLRLIAEILGWFDLIAVQEVTANFADLEYLAHLLGPSYRILFSDTAGNNERLAFIYHCRKLALLEKVGEIAVPPSAHRHIALPGVAAQYQGFDRNPYVATFRVGRTSLALANVHVYFGSTSRADIDRRALEVFAVARWADLTRRSVHSFTREIVALGDFNMPKAQPGDPIFDALTRRGLELPSHSSIIGSSIASDNRYDQIAFFPGKTQECFTGHMGAFDFDAVVFPELWTDRGQADFNAYLRYYLSDHRPIWIQFEFPVDG